MSDHKEHAAKKVHEARLNALDKNLAGLSRRAVMHMSFIDDAVEYGLFSANFIAFKRAIRRLVENHQISFEEAEKRIAIKRRSLKSHAGYEATPCTLGASHAPLGKAHYFNITDRAPNQYDPDAPLPAAVPQPKYTPETVIPEQESQPRNFGMTHADMQKFATPNKNAPPVEEDPDVYTQTTEARHNYFGTLKNRALKLSSFGLVTGFVEGES